jgi:Icc-related predicted phosphoesterase
MRLILISDTHGQHDKVNLPEGDILIHSGDLTMSGSLDELAKVADWFKKQTDRYQQIVTIAGNHDFCFEDHRQKKARDMMLEAGVYYLQNSAVTIQGLKFYGSPMTPWFSDWAFNVDRGLKIKRFWDAIPGDTDVLITHGPPHKILDRIQDGISAGCDDLLTRVLEVKPKIHTFGHLHGGRGEYELNGTKFYNSTVVDESYKVVYNPFEVTI